MSVAAMTMDDQRLHSYSTNNKMQKQYEQQSAGLSGPASPTSDMDPPPPLYQHHHQQQQQQHTEQQQQICAEQRMLEEEIESLKIEQARLIQQCTDSQRREKILTRRLANKEQEFQDYVSQIAEYKAAQAPSAMALRSALLDPAVNLLFEKLKKELKATKAKLEETQNELSAWKFTPDSNTGKRLMAKCRLLYQENEELGKMTSSGRLAKLETELAMQKNFSEEVKKSQSELDDFLQDLDEDVEGMQSTILYLQQELKTTSERIQILEKENYQLKNGIVDGDRFVGKEISNETIDNEINAQTHTGLNGTTATIAEKLINAPDDYSQQQQQQHQQEQQEQQMQQEQEMNYQLLSKNVTTTTIPTSTLAPIQEEPCVRTSAYTCGNISETNTEFYNGSTTEEHHLNTTCNEGGVIGSILLRNAATRKRTYESATECNEISPNIITSPVAATIPPMQVVQVVAPPAPRTLPPKKSKLRMTPPTTLLPDTNDLNENDTMISTSISTSNFAIENSLTITSTPADETMVIDNAVVDMAVMNEIPTAAVTASCPPTEVNCINSTGGGGGVGGNGNGNGGVAQRIMTRRRSMRTQQNGA